jgi:superfamily II DNA/RNA helicase
VKWVVQFDIQPSLKEYANRIGRTARLNESGSSLIFINEDTEMPYIDCLKKYGSKITEMNRFKLLKDFTIFAQQRYNAENRGTRVFSNDDREIEDEKYEILLFLKMMVKDTVKGNVELDTLEKSVI